ncbi:MAG: ATP-binding protein [Hyphomicrobiales bacterium]
MNFSAILEVPFRIYGRLVDALARRLPKGLYARALIIIIAPMVLLQSVVAYVFMERHWQLVTQRLSAAVVQDIAAIVEITEAYPQDSGYEKLTRIVDKSMNLDMEILPAGSLPEIGPRPFFSILDAALTDELDRKINRQFWIDTVGSSDLIEIRIQLDWGILRIIANRSQAYASNSHIFIMWMIGTSLVLLGVAIVVLRNQIRPILALADAAKSFGKGRDIDFKPRGAREIREAGLAFIEMRRRIERAIEQRTAMLNGVSHDLRTILTRFRLSLEVIEDSTEQGALKKDVDEMSRMLEAYLAFARGEAAEQAVETDIGDMLDALKSDSERNGRKTSITLSGNPFAIVRPDSFKRCLSNLVENAARHGNSIAITANHDDRWLLVCIDDDGPGIPVERREDVFKPFVRLDEARNIDEGGSGLGLAIARDIARSHGGDVLLSDSPLGGLRAIVRVPA